ARCVARHWPNASRCPRSADGRRGERPFCRVACAERGTGRGWPRWRHGGPSSAGAERYKSQRHRRGLHGRRLIRQLQRSGRGGGGLWPRAAARRAAGVPVRTALPAGTDEGRAMMQIVHDVASDANLDFYTASVSEQDFANGILALANAGCRVICDDVIYFHEPFYQTGVVANAVQTVEQKGVIFLTSAGNSDARGYQATWHPIQMATVGGTVLRNTQKFGNGSPAQTVTIAVNPMDRAVPFVVQWNQPHGKVTSALQVVVFVNDIVVARRTRHNNIPSQQ